MASQFVQDWSRVKMISRVLLFLLYHCAVNGTDTQHPSCVFNPLCTCSRPDANLGTVTCANVPLLKIPSYINRSKMNIFIMESNGLKTIEPNLMMGTGLHTLKITRNSIHEIPTGAFKGLQHTLRELELSYLKLIGVPHASLHDLQKLEILNLAGNSIKDVSQDNWANVRSSLETLILRENSISYVARNAFERFFKLRVLDLSKNILVEIDPDAFFPETHKLTHLFLADNRLRFVPYAQLQHLRALRTLDLSENLITRVNAMSESTRTSVDSKFSLNALYLKYNELTSLTVEDFEKFEVLNATYLDGNRITMIQADTFQNIRISELSLSACGLVSFHAGMLKGLERSLLVLDLSHNNLAFLDEHLFRDFPVLQEVRAFGNAIENFIVPDYNSNVLALEIAGNENTNHEALLQDTGKIKSLIRISIMNVGVSSIVAANFFGYGFGLEELSLRNAHLRSVHDGAFTNVRGIKKLDLSDNDIAEVQEHAFAEIGHSLIDLRLANAFASSVKVFPHGPLKYLSSVRHLDISNNKFEELPTSTLHGMRDLEVIRAHDCQLTTLKRETFQMDTHLRLKEATFSFNQLRILKSFTFSELPELVYVNLEDNLIESIEFRALNNLKKLRWIYLRGNRIDMIQAEAFANLPELELLDLAFNDLKTFDFTCLDQLVGSSAFLTLNLTFNSMLALNVHTELQTSIPELNIKIIDMSHNNISNIAAEYFSPVEFSLTHLYLADNLLRNTSENVFGSLHQLQWLDLSQNRIDYIERDTFRDVKILQILNFSKNFLHQVPPNLFYGMKNLRIVDLSDNRLDFLPEYSFREDSLERVLLARNYFVKVPFKSFSPEVARSLNELDVSDNSISSIRSSELLSQFQSLVYLNVSGNLLHQLDESLFFHLRKLLYLDVSHNTRLRFAENGRSFIGIQENLVYLGLTNISLIEVPHLPFPKLVYLYLSGNNISSITPESIANLTSVRVLGLDRNNLTSLPVALLSLKNLAVLNVSRNDIRELFNNSLLNGFEELDELDITKLPLSTFETGVLGRLTSLSTLHVTTYEDVDHLNVPKILEKNNALKHLHVDVTVAYLNTEMSGAFPKKLQKVTISGAQLERVDSNVLAGITCARVHLVLDGTNVASLDGDLFRQLHRVRNISLDARHNALHRLSNPSTGESLGLYNRSFLLSVKVSSNRWNCDCDIGWIETWKRTARQVMCGSLQFSLSRSAHSCMMTEDDLRGTSCGRGKPLLQSMKTELECGWSTSSYTFHFGVEYFLIILCVHFFKNIFFQN